MSEVQGIVHVDLGPLRAYRTALEADLRRRSNGPVRTAFKQWAARYRAFLRERFDTYSKGGGSWKSLEPSTIARRRKGKGSRKFVIGSIAILKDKGIMFAALDPVFQGKPGQLQEDMDFGVRVGFGGNQRHGDDEVSVADLAYWHDQGIGNPRRQIIVNPNSQVLEGMRSDMDRANGKLLKETGNA